MSNVAVSGEMAPAPLKQYHVLYYGGQVGLDNRFTYGRVGKLKTTVGKRNFSALCAEFYQTNVCPLARNPAVPAPLTVRCCHEGRFESVQLVRSGPRWGAHWQSLYAPKRVKEYGRGRERAREGKERTIYRKRTGKWEREGDVKGGGPSYISPAPRYRRPCTCPCLPHAYIGMIW